MSYQQMGATNWAAMVNKIPGATDASSPTTLVTVSPAASSSSSSTVLVLGVLALGGFLAYRHFKKKKSGGAT